MSLKWQVMALGMICVAATALTLDESSVTANSLDLRSTNLLTQLVDAAYFAPMNTVKSAYGTATLDGTGEDIGNYIYQIKAECDMEPYLRLQSGARIKGYLGIVTALHGVVGCTGITAISSQEELPEDLEVLNDLEITQVDIEHDIAVLTPKDAAERILLTAADGLIPTKTLPLLDCAEQTAFEVFLWGYPEPYRTGITRPGWAMCRKRLQQMIPPAHPQRRALADRNSPQLSIHILDVAIFATRGYSGGPLLIKDTDTTLGLVRGQVAGIVIGGLPNIAVSNAWAIPWTEIDLKPVEYVRAELDAVAIRKLPETVMAYLGTELPPLTGEQNIVVKKNYLDGAYTINVDLVEVYNEDAWLVIFLANSNPFTATPLAQALVKAPRYESIKLYILKNDRSDVFNEMENTLKRVGQVELMAQLFENNEPLDKFNRGEGYPLRDEPIILASGNERQYFWLVKSLGETSIHR